MKPYLTKTKVNYIRLGTPEKVNKWTEGALMTSQLRHNFQVSQADDGKAPHF